MTAPHSFSPLIAIGVPTWGKVSTNWARQSHPGGPLGSSAVYFEVKGKPIAQARNELMQSAIQAGADFLFMLGDDVLVPTDVVTRLLYRLWDDPSLHLVTGVYWTKQWPTAPYLWRGMQRGPYLDWKAGEFFEVDFAGCDCLLIRLSPEMQALGPDWFTTDWVWTADQPAPDAPMATEDFPFYLKCRRAGFRLMCDSGVQCVHEDRANGMQFGLLADMPQAGGLIPPLPESAGPIPIIADIGAGKDSPYVGEPGTVQVVRIDGNEELKPDIRCDVRRIPVPDEAFDVVASRHCLEHFGRGEVTTVLREWVRTLRVGGELRICVPNLAWACERLLGMEAGLYPPDPVPFWVFWGRQDDHYDFHFNGFTPRRLQGLLEHLGTLADVTVSVVADGFNLEATARKVKHDHYPVLLDDWELIQSNETADRAELPGKVAAGEAAMGLAAPPEPVAIVKPRRHRKRTPEPSEADSQVRSAQ